MITTKKPNWVKWKMLSDDEVNERFEGAHKSLGYSFKDYFFFLTEASEDFLVWEGEVYAKHE